MNTNSETRLTRANAARSGSDLAAGMSPAPRGRKRGGGTAEPSGSHDGEAKTCCAWRCVADEHFYRTSSRWQARCARRDRRGRRNARHAGSRGRAADQGRRRGGEYHACMHPIRILSSRVHDRMHVYRRTHVNACMHLSMHACMHVCMHSHMPVHACTPNRRPNAQFRITTTDMLHRPEPIHLHRRQRL